MTLHMSPTWMRWAPTGGLVVAWLYTFSASRDYPQGAAPWIAPSVQWSRFLRAIGALMALIAFVLALWLSMLLRNGL